MSGVRGACIEVWWIHWAPPYPSITANAVAEGASVRAPGNLFITTHLEHERRRYPQNNPRAHADFPRTPANAREDALEVALPRCDSSAAADQAFFGSVQDTTLFLPGSIARTHSCSSEWGARVRSWTVSGRH